MQRDICGYEHRGWSIARRHKMRKRRSTESPGIGEGNDAGLRSAAGEWHRARLRLRPDRTRLCARLQGNRGRQFRPGRFDDAGRLLRLHLHRHARSQLLARIRRRGHRHGGVRHAGRTRRGASDPRLSAVFHHHGDDRAGIFPALRGRHDLGHRRFQDRDAVQRRRVADRLAGACLRQALGDRRNRHPLRAAVSVFQPHHARHRDAGQLREHAGRLLHGYSGQARGVDRLGDQRGGRDRRRGAAGADHLHSLQCRPGAGPEGVSCRRARWLRLHPRRRGRRRADRRDREHGRLLSAAGLEGRRALHRSSGGAAAQARRPVRTSYAEEGLMRFLFKTDYEDDIRLFPHSGYIVSYGILLVFLAVAPFVLSSYLVSQLVFVCIYATVGVGLLILTGFTGQASLGHAAFLAIGAYTAAYLQQFNVPFPIYFLAGGLLTGVVGALVGFPALRLQGIYLVIATISFAFIVEEVLARWESVTHGNEGMRVKTLSLFGQAVPQNGPTFYFVCLGVLILTIVGTLNLLRSPTGRAFVAIRDSETAARSMGVNVSLYKVKSFAISAAITGFAGCLFAHKLSFISPEMFTLQLSIEFIIVILIGGAFSLHGAVLGAIFIVMIDPFLTYLKDDIPGVVAGVAATLGAGAERAAHIQSNVAAFASANGLKGAIYGVIIVVFVLFEPLGLYGRWLKIKLFFQLFPLYKRATFKRQKIYVKSERNR